MAGKIKINFERCKGCGLCVAVCPKKCIQISAESNKNGYFPAEFSGDECTACTMCALICPDAVIEVQSDDKEPSPIKEIDNKQKTSPEKNQKLNPK